MREKFSSGTKTQNKQTKQNKQTHFVDEGMQFNNYMLGSYVL